MAHVDSRYLDSRPDSSGHSSVSTANRHPPAQRLKTLLERVLEILTISLLLALTAVVLMGVFYRSVGWSLPWYDEVASIGLCWLSFYGAALAALKRAHMGFSGIVRQAGDSLRIVLFLVAEVIVIAFFAIIAWYGYRVLPIVGWDSMASMPSIGMDLVQSVIPISAVLFILCEIVSMPDAYRSIRENRDAEQDEIDELIQENQSKNATIEGQS